MNLTPHVNYLQGIRREMHSWRVLVGELIDNSLDATALNVEITLGPTRHLRVVDNGDGCDDIEAMLTLGKHKQHRATRLGIYGAGLKETAIELSGRTEIQTISDGILRSVTIDWEKLNDWSKAPDPVSETAPADRKGTTIIFSGISKGLPAFDKIVEEIGYLFSPAIAEGKQITFIQGKRRQTCAIYTQPPRTDIVDQSFSIDGRSVRINAGIIASGHKSKYPGFTIQYGHRVIGEGPSAIGSGPYGVARIAGTIELGKGWTLGKRKNLLADEDETHALEAAIYLHCEEIIRKASVQAQTLESSILTSKVSDLLSTAMSHLATLHRREKRDPGSASGTITPRDTGRRRKRATKVSNLEGIIERAAHSGLKMEWVEDENHAAMGYADVAGNRVVLNPEFNYFKLARLEDNVLAIAGAAFAIFIDRAVRYDGEQGKFSFSGKSFIESFALVLAGMPAVSKNHKLRAV